MNLFNSLTLPFTEYTSKGYTQFDKQCKVTSRLSVFLELIVDTIGKIVSLLGIIEIAIEEEGRHGLGLLATDITDEKQLCIRMSN